MCSLLRQFHVMMRGINHQNIFEEVEDYYQFIATLDRMRVHYDEEGSPSGINWKTVGTGKCLAQHLQCHLRGGLSFRGCCIIQIPSLEGKRMET